MNTFPSNTLVSMTIVGDFCSQIIRQKSSNEFSFGPKNNNSVQKYVHIHFIKKLNTRNIGEAIQ